MKPLDPNCDFDPSSIRTTTAMERIMPAIEPVTQIESVGLRQALGRVIARNVPSRVPVPNHTNSAMDGYALKGSALPDSGERMFHVIGTAFAGKPFREPVSSAQCVRIMTGAVMPAGTDTVVMQERVTLEGNAVRISSQEKAGANVRLAGEDLNVGDIALPMGIRIGPSHLGLAASLGFSELPVFRRPRVAFFSNGDELRSVGEPIEVGELYDSNRYTLYGMLSESGVEMVDLGIVRDDPVAIRQAFKAASGCADMIITSAGASVGEADYVQDTLAKLGEVMFWKVAIKPGRPLSFGIVGDAVFFGLPGNPVSVMVTFEIFVRAALQKMSGEISSGELRIRVPTQSKLRKRPGRMEYQRGILRQDAEGRTVVHSTGDQGSGILHSMSAANCYIILPDESDGATPGDWVEVQPFRSAT